MSVISFGYKQKFNLPHSVHVNKVGSQKPFVCRDAAFSLKSNLELSIDCQSNDNSVYKVKTL